MTPFLSKRLLINIAVVAAAVGANAFVAYTQICGQRDADARMLRSTSVRQNLDAYQSALDGGLAALGRFEASGESAPAGSAAAMVTTLARLERDLRSEFAGEPAMLAALARLSADSYALQHDIDDALLRSAGAGPNA
jgi:hypothetical protein